MITEPADIWKKNREMAPHCLKFGEHIDEPLATEGTWM